MSIKKNFSSRLSLYVLLISAGLMVVVTVALAILAAGVLRQNAREKAELTLENTVLEIEKMLKGVERAVDNLDWMVLRNLDDEEYLYDLTREMVTANANVVGSAVAFEPGFYKGRHYFSPYTYVGDVSGEIHTIQLGNENYDYPTLDWYQIPKLLGKAYWSEPYYDDGGGGQRMSTYSMPLNDEDGNFIGILTADLSLEWLSDMISTIKPFEDSYTIIIGRNAAYISHPDDTRVLNETIFTAAMEMQDTTAFTIGREMVAGHHGMTAFINDDQASFIVYGPLSNGWSVAMVCSYGDVFGMAVAVILIIAFFLLIGLVALFFGCRRIIRRMTDPVVEFGNAAMTIAKGNFNATIPEVYTKDEIRTLRNSLAYMQRSINSYIAELKTTTASNERYESELNIAREIQMSMLPTNFPNHPEFDLYAEVRPAKEVGGDLYDFLEVGDSVFFLVGDVSGKGVPAALFMAITRAAFRFVGALGLPMSEVMYRVNNTLCDGNENNMFVTIFAARLDTKTGEMEYCNAGHNPIVILNQEGKASFLSAKPNLAAGLIPDFPYIAERTRLEFGSRLILYTDGVTEAEREDKAQFGEEALLNWASKLPWNVNAKGAAHSLHDEVKQFTEGADQNDDITIMVIDLNETK